MNFLSNMPALSQTFTWHRSAQHVETKNTLQVSFNVLSQCPLMLWQNGNLRNFSQTDEPLTSSLEQGGKCRIGKIKINWWNFSPILCIHFHLLRSDQKSGQKESAVEFLLIFSWASGALFSPEGRAARGFCLLHDSLATLYLRAAEHFHYPMHDFIRTPGGCIRSCLFSIRTKCALNFYQYSRKETAIKYNFRRASASGNSHVLFA